VNDELERILPVIKEIHKRFPDTWLSSDTYHAVVAAAAVTEGVSIINDVSAGKFDDQMMKTVAGLKVPYIAMHMQGTPKTMQQNPSYDDVIYEVRDELREVCDACSVAGIDNVIIDPGFGFGKTTGHNFSLLGNLRSLRILGRPILAGISRKSMICKTLGVTPENALNGTTALHMVALHQGANILRVHDVKEAVEVVKLHEQFV
jgi:dihydropteroate synthase